MCLFFTGLLVSGFGTTRTEKCAHRVRSVWTSVIHLSWSTLFVIAASAAVGGAESEPVQFSLAETPSSTLGYAHTFTPGSFPVKPQFDLLVTADR